MSWLLPLPCAIIDTTLAYLSVWPILETAVFNLDCCLSAFKIAMQSLWLQSGRALLLADVVFLEQAVCLALWLHMFSTFIACLSWLCIVVNPGLKVTSVQHTLHPVARVQLQWSRHKIHPVWSCNPPC